MNQPNLANQKRLIEKSVVKGRLGNPSDTTLWRLEKRGVIPKSIRLTNGKRAWFEHEIDEFLDRRAAERQAP